MAEFCLECLQKLFEPNANRCNSILTSELNICEGCGEFKQTVFSFGNQLFNTIAGDIRVKNYCSFDVCEELDFTLGALVNDLGWDEIRNRYIYLESQESGKPLVFKTHQEYEPYFNYRVVKLNNTILLRDVRNE